MRVKVCGPASPSFSLEAYSLKALRLTFRRGDAWNSYNYGKIQHVIEAAIESRPN
jgi:hypothetical protein